MRNTSTLNAGSGPSFGIDEMAAEPLLKLLHTWLYVMSDAAAATAQKISNSAVAIASNYGQVIM